MIAGADGAARGRPQRLPSTPVTPPTVAVVGGGQLARMMAAPATALGLHLRVLVEAPDVSAAQALADAPVGAASDVRSVLGLVEGAHVLTFEHEHVPAAVLAAVSERGVAVHPSPAALVHAQDKQVMRRRLTELGVPCPRWAPVVGLDDLERFRATVGGRAVVKTTRGGYDGKGVRVVQAGPVPDDVVAWCAAAADGTGPALIAEELVDFTRELAVLVARTPSGSSAVWPVVESVQRDGVCAEVVAPAPGLDPVTAERAEAAARTVADSLEVTGVLAVEMFEVADAAGGPPHVLVNELAMRPHNSGHWTIDGAVTSQFEQHLRAVLDLPLGDTSPVARWTVMANVLGSALEDPTDALPDVLGADPGARVHLYGKEVRAGRKLGHVNVSGDDLEDVRARARAAAARLRGETIDGGTR